VAGGLSVRPLGSSTATQWGRPAQGKGSEDQEPTDAYSDSEQGADLG
jgi:hypothetical protein